MKSLFVQGQMQDSQDSTRRQQRDDLRKAIEEFLAAASSSVPRHARCPRCGAEMQYVDTTFQLYGAEPQWEVRVPYCCCTLPDGSEIATQGAKELPS